MKSIDYRLAADVLILVVFAAVLIYTAVVDIKTTLIPKWTPVILLAVGISNVVLPLCFHKGNTDIVWIMLNAVGGMAVVVIPLFFTYVINENSIGGGDIKLCGSSGIYLGLIGSCLALVLSNLIFVIYGALKKRRKQIKQEIKIPYAPFYAVGGISIAIFNFMEVIK